MKFDAGEAKVNRQSGHLMFPWICTVSAWSELQFEENYLPSGPQHRCGPDILTWYRRSFFQNVLRGSQFGGE